MFDAKNISKETKGTESVPQAVREAVFVKSACVPENTPIVKGYNWDQGIDYQQLMRSFATTGIQATNFSIAVKEVNDMLKIREEKYTRPDYFEQDEDEFISPKSNITIFLGYTSNMVTSGTRETIKFLVKNKMVDCLVTTAGGIEEDFIKCLAPFYVGSFQVDDRLLRDNGINRAGNILIPNENYCLFETWVTPILDQMIEEQNKNKVLWTPSKLIARLGKEIANDDSMITLGREIAYEESIYYWAYKNKIPVFCPALTDGSLGDMMYFHSFRNPGLVLDIVEDLGRLNTIAVRAKNTGMIILGGGVIKHHVCNANLMRNGADYSVYINTAFEYDGSDSGARPEEAISWGKIRKHASPVKVFGDASIMFPILVAETFAKKIFSKEN